jgi:hypothetical protein
LLVHFGRDVACAYDDVIVGWVWGHVRVGEDVGDRVGVVNEIDVENDVRAMQGHAAKGRLFTQPYKVFEDQIVKRQSITAPRMESLKYKIEGLLSGLLNSSSLPVWSLFQ